MKVIYCKYIPNEIETDAIYISEEFGCSIHFCGCGCGSKIPIPIKPFCSDGWTLTKNPDGSVTFDPSLQHRGGCKSHYFIRNSQIVLC